MTQKIVIAGSGFAGLWSAMSAARAIHMANKQNEIEIIMVSPKPELVIRPRLYEKQLENMNPDISSLLESTGVKYISGCVEKINEDKKQLMIRQADKSLLTLDYDRFILATGSKLFTPNLPGLNEHGFNVDTLDGAQVLDTHLHALPLQPDASGRNTVVVAGGGLTGLECATEMPERLRAVFGDLKDLRVILVDSAPEIGDRMGKPAASAISEALQHCGVETRVGVRVAELSADSVLLSSGERIATQTVVWTAGIRAHALTEQITGERDGQGRIIGDAFLRAPATEGIFVTGDTVKVPSDDIGNFNVMSCQHAMSLGRVAGHNAAAELTGLPLHPYSQPKYVTCIDLGSWGALYTEGWDYQIHYTREDARKIKQEINTLWIYPPVADRDAVFAVANPDYVIVP
jgi:NADH dehydrogenase